MRDYDNHEIAKSSYSMCKQSFLRIVDILFFRKTSRHGEVAPYAMNCLHSIAACF